MYLPEFGARITDAHSIYFEIMGEQGFIGLALFLMLGIFALSACSRIIKQTKNDPEILWMRNLAAMMQVSLIGYAVSGAFLGLAYFDYYYALLAIVVGMTVVLKQHVETSMGTASTGAENARRVSARNEQTGIQAPHSLNLKQWIAWGKQWYDRL